MFPLSRKNMVPVFYVPYSHVPVSSVKVEGVVRAESCDAGARGRGVDEFESNQPECGPKPDGVHYRDYDNTQAARNEGQTRTKE